MMAGRVLVVGAGGLGCPAALALAWAGVPMTICDDDRVDLSNLQRQVLHTTARVGAAKVESAITGLGELAGDVDCRALEVRLDATNAAGIIAGHALVIDGTDSVEAKFLLSDVAVATGVPLVHGGVVRFVGQVLVVVPGGPCYRCLFESPPDEEAQSCGDAGVLGAMAGVIGGLQAERALDVLGGRAADWAGRLTIVDGLLDTTREVVFRRRLDCPACAPSPTPSPRELQ
jgi:adenylyltransferase/sulfurtransferase